MPSLYDNVKFANSQYVPQFVGSNYDVLKETGDKLEERYNRNRELTDQVQIALANQEIDPTDEPIRAARLKKIQDDLDLISSSPENFENSTNAVSRMAKEFATDPHLIAAKRNYQQVQEAEKLRNDMKAKGLGYFDYNQFKGTLNPDGTVNNYRADVRQDIDKNKVIKELMGTIANSGYIMDVTGKQIKLGDKDIQFFKEGNVQGVSAKRVEELSDMLLNAYKSTAAGKQDIETLTRADLAAQRSDINAPLSQEKMLNYVSPTGKTYTKNEVDANLFDKIIANTSPQIGTVARGNWTPIDTYNYGNNQEQPTNPLLMGKTNPGSVTDNTSLKVPEDSGDLVKKGIVFERNGQWYRKRAIDVNGNPLPDDQILNDAQKGSSKGGMYNERAEPIDAPDKILSERQQMFDNLVKDDPQLLKVYGNFDKYNESLNSAVKNHAKVNPTGTTIEKEQKESYNNTINSLLPSSPIYFKDGTKTTTLQELADDIGVSPTDIKLDAAQVFWDSPKADLPGGYVEARVNVSGDKKGKDVPTSVFVPVSNEFSQIAGVVDNLYKNSFYRGQDYYTADKPYNINELFEDIPHKDKSGNDIVYKTKTMVIPKENQQEGKPAFRTVVVAGIKNPDGTYSYRDDTKMSIGQWKEVMKKFLAPKISNVLNSGTQTFNSYDFKQQGINEY